jgi:hypothetical protein
VVVVKRVVADQATVPVPTEPPAARPTG